MGVVRALFRDLRLGVAAVLVAVAGVVALVAIVLASDRSTAPDAELLPGTTWEVVEFNTPDLSFVSTRWFTPAPEAVGTAVLDPRQIRIRFGRTHIDGVATCQDFRASYVVQGTDVAFSETTVDDRLCVEQEVVPPEIVEVIRSATRIEVTGDGLIELRGPVGEISFEEVDSSGDLRVFFS